MSSLSSVQVAWLFTALSLFMIASTLYSVDAMMKGELPSGCAFGLALTLILGLFFLAAGVGTLIQIFLF